MQTRPIRGLRTSMTALISVAALISGSTLDTIIFDSGSASATHISTTHYVVRAAIENPVTPVLTDTLFDVTGHLSRAAPHSTVSLEVKRGRKWAAVSNTLLTAGKLFRFRVRENRPGNYEFRVVKNAVVSKIVGTIRQGFSSPMREPVAVWTYLENMNAVTADSGGGKALINGASYLHSLLFVFNSYATPQTDTSQYNLSRSCSELKGVFGIDDTDPDPTDSAEFNLQADGTSIFDQTLPIGQSAPFDINVAGVLRLTINITFDSNAGNVINRADVGNPEVLCTRVPSQQQ